MIMFKLHENSWGCPRQYVLLKTKLSWRGRAIRYKSAFPHFPRASGFPLLSLTQPSCNLQQIFDKDNSFPHAFKTSRPLLLRLLSVDKKYW
ncbi:MAG: hypothetical protein K0R51_349 [Cytophagaceae bacterium]|jgi:hypothetical protein|nr:hypothetical protein [Cytophagaceae bacterium]